MQFKKKNNSKCFQLWNTKENYFASDLLTFVTKPSDSDVLQEPFHFDGAEHAN